MILNIRNEAGCSKSFPKPLFKSCLVCSICPRCNKKFMKVRERHKFCSSKCKNQFNAIARHNKLKNNPEYKEKAKRQFAIWRERNKEKHNAYMRAYMKHKINTERGYRDKQKEYYKRKIENLALK